MKLTPDEQRRAEHALREGKITKQEYNFLLGRHHEVSQKEHDTKLRSASIRFAIAAIIVLAATISFFLTGGGGVTGLVIAEWNESTYTNYTLIDLGITDVASIRVSGEIATGSTTINALVNNETYEVFTGTIIQPRIWTTKTTYGVNETIDLEVDLDNYTLWVVGENRTPAEEPLRIAVPGMYTLEALGDEKLSINIEVSLDPSEKLRLKGPIVFENECTESCAITTSGPVLLEVITDGTVNVTDVIAGIANNPPQQTQALPDLTLEGIETINLSDYFVDDDGDSLSYETNNLIGIIENLEEDVLTLEGGLPGEYRAVVYASDGQAITTAEYTITVPEETAEEVNETAPIETNETTTPEINETTDEPTNTTETPTDNETNTSASSESAVPVAPTSGCDDPDPNKRPLACLQNETNFFVEQEIVLEDVDRRVVGKFTPIGNLLLTGDVIERTLASPRSGDWSIGILGFDGYTPTIWIDSDTGDLHLRGTLTEANTNIVHEEGLFGLTNERGILLAKANRNTGDLIVRGNIIPFRRSLE